MMATVAAIDIVLGLDTKKMERDLTDAERSLTRLRRAGQKMKRFGRAMTVGVTLPLAAAGTAAVKMATDAVESANKFDVVMGEAADDVRTRLEQLTKTIPETTIGLQRMAAGLQDMLVPMGVARRDAAGMSADMVKLAGDLASFNNVPIERALEAMKSGLAGMSRPLRRFGVDTRQAKLETIALQEGLIEAGEELNTTAQAQAVMIAIQRDSQDAMGDAARTADDAAQVFRFLKRDVRELGEQFGRLLLPRVRKIAKRLSEMLNRVDAMDEGTKDLIITIGGLLAAAGPVLLMLSQLTIAVTDVIATVATAGGLTAALSSLGAALTGPAGIITLLGVGLVTALIKIKTHVSEAEEAFRDMKKAIKGIEDPEALRARAAPLRERQAALQEDRRRLREELEALRDRGAPGRLLAGKEAALSNVTENLRDINRVLRPLDRKLKRLTLDENLTKPAEDAQQMVANLRNTIRDLARTMLEGLPSLDIRTVPGTGFMGFSREAMRTARQAGGPFQGRVTGDEDFSAFTQGGGVVAEAARSASREQENLAENTTSTAEVIQGTLVPAISAVANISRGAASAIIQLFSSILQGLSMIPGIGAGFGAAGSILGAFAGFFQHGGRIPAGQFGVVGERGPEFVRGPADVQPIGAGAGRPMVDPDKLQRISLASIAIDPVLQEILGLADDVGRQTGRLG